MKNFQFGRLVRILAFEDSRKMGLCLWIIVLASYFFYSKYLDGSNWMACIAMASAVGGFGTVADKRAELEKMKIQGTIDAPVS